MSRHAPSPSPSPSGFPDLSPHVPGFDASAAQSAVSGWFWSAVDAAERWLDDGPTGLILIVAGVWFFAWMMLRPLPQPKTCGTCGVDLRREKHEPWCRQGRWGGKQRWEND